MTAEENPNTQQNRILVYGAYAVIIIVLLAVIAVGLFIAGIILWQLGLFSTPSDGTVVTSTGFARIKPQLVATQVLTDGRFTSVFTNGVGTTINLTGVTIEDLNDPTCSCTLASSQFTPHIVSAGDNMKLSAEEGCIARGKQNEPYLIKVSLDYTVTIGGITQKRQESGILRGPYE